MAFTFLRRRFVFCIGRYRARFTTRPMRWHRQAPDRDGIKSERSKSKWAKTKSSANPGRPISPVRRFALSMEFFAPQKCWASRGRNAGADCQKRPRSSWEFRIGWNLDHPQLSASLNSQRRSRAFASFRTALPEASHLAAGMLVPSAARMRASRTRVARVFRCVGGKRSSAASASA